MTSNTGFAGTRRTARAYLCQSVSIAAVATATQVLLTASSGALAADAGQAAQAVNLEEIVVTGSRVATNGMQAPTPVTVVNSDFLKDQRPGDLFMALQELPVFSNSTSPQTAATTTNGANVANDNANLRGLGATRTLILLNGRRVVAASDSGIPDIATFPGSIVQRVDVVTGGASAAYGSDAVSGVVNFVLDTSYEGLKGDVQAGISSRGDRKNYRGEITAGTTFGGGRGHFILSGDYSSTDGLTVCDREWTCEKWTVIGNAGVTTANATEARPLRGLYKNVQNARIAVGGLFYDAQGPLSNIAFGPGGQPVPFIKGAEFNGTTMVGGSGDNAGDGAVMYAVRNAYSVFNSTTYEISDNVKASFEGSLGHTFINNPAFPTRHAPTADAYIIFSGNPYLPASIQAIMTAKNIASVRMGRIDADYVKVPRKFKGGGNESASQEYLGNNDMRRVAFGLDGKFSDDWSFGLNYSYGHNKIHVDTTNDPELERSFYASDAVLDPATGNIICHIKTVLPNSTDPKVRDCVPMNLFGNGSPSQASLNYVVGTDTVTRVNIQHFAEATVNGTPFSTWAGPASTGFGVSYRKENLDQTSDPIAQVTVGAPLDRGMPANITGRQGGHRAGNNPALSGEVEVKEAFGEVLMPLAKDTGWAKSLDLNGAVRYSDYSTSGGVVTWKGGLVWEPMDGLRFRGTRSRDIRAGNMAELFQTGTGAGLTARDPFNNNIQTTSGQSITQGNPTVKPEKADTTTIGVTYQPDFIPGLGASVDWYKINIKDAITTLGAQNILDQCFAGAAFLCTLIRRGTDGQITQIYNQTVNASFVNSNGIDFEINYRTYLGDIVDNWDGNVIVRALGNHVGKRETLVLGGTPNDAAGGTGAPKWRWNLTMQYTNGPLGVTLTERYISSVKFDVNAGPTDLSPKDNHIKSFIYTNLAARYKVGADENYEVYATVRNLFDNRPPAIAALGTTGTTPLAQGLYDYVGREFSVGVRFTR